MPACPSVPASLQALPVATWCACVWGDRSMLLGPSATLLCLFTGGLREPGSCEPAPDRQWQLLVLSFHNWSGGWLPSQRVKTWQLCLSPPPLSLYFACSLTLPTTPFFLSGPVCSASQCTSSNIVFTSWQSDAICTSCQGSCCHGYKQQKIKQALESARRSVAFYPR